MCELTEVNYLDGDIVWVKLGPCWWPGEVWGEKRLPEDALHGFKKLPIAVVKFFQEESFEYVKNVSNIYKYNCSKKDEFIKKGLDKFRAKNSFMEKFPADLRKAEELTGGDPNIADDSKYAPSPRVSYHDIYGTPIQKKKKSALKATSTSPSTSKLKSSPGRKGKSAITSPYSPAKTPKGRFSEYGASQYDTPDGPMSQAKYNCYLCGFKSNRLNVIVLHTKQHSANSSNSSMLTPNRYSSNSSLNATQSSINSQSPARVSGISRTSSIQDDLKIIRSSELAEKKEKEKSAKGKMSPGVTPKGKKRGRPPKKVEAEVSVKKIKTDYEIKSKLLADWSDDQDSDTEGFLTISKSTENSMESTNEPETPTEEKINENINNAEGTSITESRTSSIEKSEDEMKPKSCFDFEEDDVIDVIPKSPGRKIPRLITKKTKKEFEYTPEPADAKSEEALQQVEETSKSVTNSNDETSTSTSTADNNQIDNTKKFDIDLDDILNVTKPPELPEIPKDKFDKESEVTASAQNKPVREIMSPKERGKRIFKSKQIFKTKMQEKFENELKLTDVSDVMPDGDQSVKADLIAIVEKTANQQNEQDDDAKENEDTHDNSEEQVLKKDPQPVEVLKIVSEVETIDSVVVEPEPSNHNDIDNNVKMNDEHLESSILEEPKANLLYNITEETLKSNNNKSDDTVVVPKSPHKRRKSRNSLGESKVQKSPSKEVPPPVVEEPVPEVSQIDSKIVTENDIQNDGETMPQQTIETPEKESLVTKSVSPEKHEKDDKSDEMPPPEKKMKGNSTWNDAECLINFSESVYTEKEKEEIAEFKSEKKKPKSPRKSIDSSIDMQVEKPAASHFGLGSLDSTEPLQSIADNAITAGKSDEDKPTDEIKPIKDTVKPSVGENNVQELSNDNKIEVPDIQSYITNKSQPEKEVNMPMKSRLHDMLTENITPSPTKMENLKSKPVGNKSPESKNSLAQNLKPKKQFVIKMKNEKKETLNKELIKSAIDQIEDIETFVIEKPKPKPPPVAELVVQPKTVKTEVKILKKQPKKPAILSKQSVVKTIVQEDPIFDINSMPIVLSDELLTAENLDQMPMVLSKSSDDTNIMIDNNLIIVDQKQDDVPCKIEQKLTTLKSTPKMQIIKKIEKPSGAVKLQMQKTATTSTSASLAKTQVIYQAPAKTKMLKSGTTVVTQPGKPGKFIVIPSSSSATGSKYTVGKRLQQKTVAMKISPNSTNETSTQLKIGNKTSNQASKPIIQKVVQQKVNIDSSGNTVLFITNSNGEQSKVVLTPDQKMPGMKSSVTPQTIVTSKGAIINPKQSSPIVTTSKPSQLILTSKGQIISRSTLQTTSKMTPMAIKQKTIAGNASQTLLTSKGSLITPGQLLTSTGQLIQPSQQLVMGKGSVLTPLTPNQMKKFKNPTQRIIVNKKSNIGAQPSTLIKDKGVTSRVVQNQIEKPKAPVQKKGFVKLSSQQLADMEKLGFVEETDHGKIITHEGLRHMQAMGKDKNFKIQTLPQQHRKLKPGVNAPAVKKVTAPSTAPNPTADNTNTVVQKRTMLLNKQPALPPLTPIGESKTINQQEVYQKVLDNHIQDSRANEFAMTEQTQDASSLMSQTTPQAQEETVAPPSTSVDTTVAAGDGELSAAEPTLSALPDAQLLAVPGETFGGPTGSFFLCSVEDNGNLTPIDNQPLYLDANNQLVPAAGMQDVPQETTSAAAAAESIITPPAAATEVSEQTAVAPGQLDLGLDNLENQQIIINAEGQQFIIDQQSLLALTEQQMLTSDGQQLIFQGNAQQILAALSGGHEVNMLDENTLAAAAAAGASNVTYQHEFGNKDILATALANTNVFQNEGMNPELEIYQNLQTDYKHSSVSETSAALSQPIMSPLELPSKKPEDNDKIEGMNFNQNIDDSLAVIGVNSATVPTSLDLPITITNPKIAPKSTNPLNMACEMIYQSSSYSPVTSKELATGDIFQPQEIAAMSEQTILQSSSDVVTTLSMPDLSGGDVTDSEMPLSRMDPKNGAFPAESMPLLNDDDAVDSSTKDVPAMDALISKPDSTESIVYSEHLPTEIVEPSSLLSNDDKQTDDLKTGAVSTEEHANLHQQDDDQTVTNGDNADINAESKALNELDFRSDEIKTAQKEEAYADNMDSTLNSSTSEKIFVPTTCIENAFDALNVNSENSILSNSGKDTAIENPHEMRRSSVQDSESICPLQVNEKEETKNMKISKITPQSSDNAEATKNVENDSRAPIAEIERSESVTTPVTSEINIITENLHFGSEASDLLTPETLVSPKSPSSELPQDFCESSNSCEIPIQPNLVYDQNKEIEQVLNNQCKIDSQVVQNDNENNSDEIINNVDPSSNLFDFDAR